MKLAVNYFLTLLVFLGIDGVWLAVIAKDLYQREIGQYISKSPNWLAAGIFYLLFVAGLMVFAIVPGLKENSMIRSITTGALFGLCCYGTYDLTNRVTLANWPVKIVIIDMLWGSFLGGVCAAAGWWIGNRIGN